MEGILQLPKLEDLVVDTGKLAVLPATVVDLLRLLSDPLASAGQVQKVLDRDPAMTSNVLKISNSAFYGVRREIASVRDALVMLGNRRTATLGLATAMVPILRRDLKGYGMTRDQFWNHSLLTASASSEAARHLGMGPLQCEAFTAGLIHDIGLLVLDPVLADLGFNGEVRDPGTETQALGFSHCQAGALLAEHWGFPQILIDPVGAHHQGPKDLPGEGVVRAVVAGNLLAEAATLEPEDSRLTEVVEDLEVLGLTAKLVDDLRLDLAENMGEICGAAASLAPARS
jgi:HD-like signal output (HDOD) protein